jgi:hypothetical protein
MSRTRISTTVDSTLLDDARNTRAGTNDAELIDAALAALLDRYRRAEVDGAYKAAYEAHPIDEADEWGDLGSFGEAASAT